jgi:hypothetical protein
VDSGYSARLEGSAVYLYRNDTKIAEVFAEVGEETPDETLARAAYYARMLQGALFMAGLCS